MKKKILGIIGIFSLILGAVVISIYANDLSILGLTLAIGVPVAGTVTTEVIKDAASDMGEDIIRDDWSSEIAKIRPSDAPLDTMLRTIGAISTSSYKINMASIDVVSGSIIVDGSVSQNSAGTVVNIIVSADTLKEALIHRTLQYQDTTLDKKVGLYIVGKNKTTRTISCVVIGGAGTGDQIGSGGIADDTVLYVIGTAKYEKDAQTEPYAKLPEIDHNLCQIQMCQVEESVYSQMQEKEIDYGLLEFKDNALYNFRLDCERTHSIGIRSTVVDPTDTDRTIYMSGGYEYFTKTKVYYVPNEVEANGGMSMSLWNRIGKEVFTTNGSPERVLFYEPGFMVQLLKSVEFQKMMDNAVTEIVYGVKCKKVETGFGVINLAMSHALTKAGRFNEAFIIDPKKIRLKYFQKMQWKEIKLEDSGQSKANAWRLEERSACEFFNVKTGCWIYPSATNITNPDDQIINL
jgi:hypothetical protein